MTGNNIQADDQQLIDFFSYCAERMSKENNVSDFLFALLKSSSEMIKIFSDFLGTEVQLSRFDIEREFNISNIGRPDFHMRDINGNPLIVEVKLYDTDYHEEYSEIEIYGKKPKISLLLINEPQERPLYECSIKYWSELIGLLGNSTNPLLKAFSNYLEKVINMEKYDAVNMMKPVGLRNLNYMMKDIIRTYKSENEHIKTSNISTNFKEDESGYFYSIKNIENNGYEVWPFFGLVYNDSNEGFIIWIIKKDNEKYYDSISKTWKELCNRPEIKHEYKEDKKFHEYLVRMSDSDQEQFFKSSNIDEQKGILRSFFEMFNNAIEKELLRK